MGSNPWESRHLLINRGGEDLFGYPDSHQAWTARYQLLLDLAHGDTYPHDVIKEHQLFRAFDDAGEVIALTQAYYRERQYIIEVAVGALALGEVTLNPTEGASASDVARAEAIWKRSMPDDGWAFTLAAAGDLYVEPARADRGSPDVTIIPYAPQNCVPVYGMVHRSRLQRVTITSSIVDDPEVDAEGNVTEQGQLYTHQRRVTRTEIEVAARLPADEEGQEQVEIDEAASGAHGLGVCPAVHIRCVPVSYPEHAMPVTNGLDRGLMLADSLISQIKAVGDRFANPKPYLFGAQMGSDSAFARFGRWLNIWGTGSEKVEVGYMEPSMGGIRELREQLAALLDDIRTTFPEYLFNGGSTANLSAEALQLLATQYERKYSAIRRRLYGGLERALAIGVAMEQRRPYDPNNHPIKIEGPPLLPANIKAALEALQLAQDLGGVTAVDVVRHTQKLGLADQDVAAEDYAALVAEEQMGRVAGLMGDTPGQPTVDDEAGDGFPGFDGDDEAEGAFTPRLVEAALQQVEALLDRAPEELREELEEAAEALRDAVDEAG